MEKKLKRCYEYLDLNYLATAEDVEARKNALIKIANSSAKEKRINVEDEIQKIEDCANKICENLSQNGMPNEDFLYNPSNESLVGIFISLLFAVFFCWCSFCFLL